MNAKLSIVAVIALALLFNTGMVAALYGYSNAVVSAETNSAVKMNANTNSNVEVRANANVSANVKANTSINATVNSNSRSNNSFQLSNGLNANVKIMPEVASEIAIERLQLRVCSEENNCTIQLKEVNENSEIKAAYQVEVDKEARIFGLFKKTVKAKVLVDAESGQVIQVSKPWYAKLTSDTSVRTSATSG